MTKILQQPPMSAQENMQQDEKILQSLDPQGKAILNFYNWRSPSATYGYFLNPDKVFFKEKTLDIYKRPTGGGVLFHIWDVAFSVFIPQSHRGYSQDIMQNYQFVNNIVLLAIQDFLKEQKSISLLPEEPVAIDPFCQNFCFAKPTKYDIMIQGKKIAGAAQRRKKNGFLHQGSISVAHPDFAFLEKILLPQGKVIEAMQQHTFIPLEKDASLATITGAKEDLKKHLQKKFLELA